MSAFYPDEAATSAAPLAIIGGNALGALPDMVITKRRVERTPYGDPSAPLLFGTLERKPIVFLARHGVGFNLSPEEVNDVANIYALKELAPRAIIGISSAIGLDDQFLAGDFVIPDQLIDVSNDRISRFPRDNGVPSGPLQFADPFDNIWREALYKCAPRNIRVHQGGTYVLTSGLRSETRAEAHFYRTVGGSALGATGAQEAALARDINIPYVLLLVIVRKAVNLSPPAPQNLNLGDIALSISQWMGKL